MAKNLQIATVGGGCFWCTEAVFQEVKGVEKSFLAMPAERFLEDPPIEKFAQDSPEQLKLFKSPLMLPASPMKPFWLFL